MITLVLLLMVAAFITGVICTLLVLLRVGSGREDRGATLSCAPPTRAAAFARLMTGLHARTTKPFTEDFAGSDDQLD